MSTLRGRLCARASSGIAICPSTARCCRHRALLQTSSDSMRKARAACPTRCSISWRVWGMSTLSAGPCSATVTQALRCPLSVRSRATMATPAGRGLSRLLCRSRCRRLLRFVRALELSQHLLWVSCRVDLLPDARNLPLLVDQEAVANDALVLAAHELLRPPAAVGL